MSSLIVDEPTVGLDPEERIRFRNLLSTLSEDKIVILSTHIVSDIESIANNIAILSHGNIVEYTEPENLIENVKNKVWECVMPIEEFNQVKGRYKVSTSIHSSDGIHARIICEKPPIISAKNIIPSLEDSYLYYTESRGDI